MATQSELRRILTDHASDPQFVRFAAHLVASEGFAQLGPTHRRVLLDAFLSNPTNDFEADLVQLTSGPGFRNSADIVKAEVLHVARRFHRDVPTRRMLCRLVEAPGFGKLGLPDQLLVLGFGTPAGTNDGLGARTKLLERLEPTVKAIASQDALLAGALKGLIQGRGSADPTPGMLDAEWALSPQREHGAPTAGPGAGSNRYDIRIGGRSFAVHVPDGVIPTGEDALAEIHAVRDIAVTLVGLPASLRERIEGAAVRPEGVVFQTRAGKPFGLSDGPGFGNLSPAHRNELLSLLKLERKPSARHAGVSHYRADLCVLANNADFAELSDTVKSLLIETLGRFPDDAFARGALIQLAQLPGFKYLPDAEKLRLLRYAGGRDQVTAIASDGRRGLWDTVIRLRLVSDWGEQAKALQEYLREQPNQTFNVAHEVRTFGNASATVVIHRPPTKTSGGFDGVAGPGVLYDVEVAGVHVPVTLPEHVDPSFGTTPSIEQVAAALAAMPSGFTSVLSAVIANPIPAPTHGGRGGGRGEDTYTEMATDASRTVWIYPANGFSQVALNCSLLHEIGHTLSHLAWGPDSRGPAWKDWRLAMASDALSVSQYGRRSADEDFAEAWALYNVVRGTAEEAEFRAMYPGRFEALDAFTRTEVPRLCEAHHPMRTTR